MYAVIALQGHQYLVKKGDTISVDQIDADLGSKLSCSDVLLTFKEDGSAVKV